MNNAIDELRSLVMRAETQWTDTGLPRVAMVQAEACASQVYQPMLHLVLQGAKTLSIGDQVLQYLPITYFLVPVDVPATGEIHPSGPGRPYLAISLTLDPNVIATLLTGETLTAEQPATSRFCAVSAPAEMIDAWLRMMRLMDRPNEAAVLGPMIEREILFRVLQGPLGPMLREIARPDGRLAQVRRATQWIGEHYTEPFHVEPLATMTDMSVASFYRHFKSITGMTPIQYQKRLRLLRARWLLLFEPRDAASIAFTVGYESASQFSREYARLFGMPPARDVARFRTSTPEVIEAP
ncbi:AraC family transcriptional regulator [Pseudomonas hefeiensis]|uniref:AraC family transcriptional regulator n=1 Tax=Pseudomonas hefeiensis TaxID=2738125 RepID=A0ABY9GIX4_9PSED|nr:MULTISPECIES: AraC family transcriptional regulator [unclassified Pseudomonas]WLH15118.1 AraC family transcriptional regulator [Pseudomonas sp. FP205]WLH98165.1 AraC family transcriptional regulator [Pseudomonas sp. FP53]WLI42441.1 AraC family transcriptional regulator [Pseudomonas sp. FP821]